MEKLLFPFFFFLPLSVLAQYPFNGTYCGKGTVNLNGKAQSGIKILEVATSSNTLRLIRSKVILDNGGYIDGRPEEAQILDGQIIYNGTKVGTISWEELYTKANIAGFDIEYTVRNLGPERISYSRISTNASNNFYMSEGFTELTKNSCP